MNTPKPGDDEYAQWAALFNDITRGQGGPDPFGGPHLPFSARRRLATYLWERGWRITDDEGIA